MGVAVGAANVYVGGGTLLWIEIWHFWLLERVELDIDEVHKKGGKKKKKKKRQKRDEK